MSTQKHIQNCPKCKGSGYLVLPSKMGTGGIKCTACDGTGILQKKDKEKEYKDTLCQKCNGTGIFKGKKCSTCNGRGRMLDEENAKQTKKQSLKQKVNDLKCPKCNGTGWKVKPVNGKDGVKCQRCGGTGNNPNNQNKIEVKSKDVENEGSNFNKIVIAVRRFIAMQLNKQNFNDIENAIGKLDIDENGCYRVITKLNDSSQEHRINLQYGDWIVIDDRSNTFQVFRDWYFKKVFQVENYS